MEDWAEENDPETTSPSSLQAIHTASHSCIFKFVTNETGGKRKLISDKFVAGGYEWAIDFYPSGTRSEDHHYISLFITLESIATHVIARFELILADQSGKEKHRIQSNFGIGAPCLMKHQGSQWGFRRFIKKSQLQKSYLKDDYLLVKCRVGVLEVCQDSPLAVDQVQDLEPVYSPLSVNQEESEAYNFKNAKVRKAVKLVLETALGVNFNEECDKFDQYLRAVDEIQESIKLGTITDHETKGVDLIQMTTERLLAEFRNISDRSINMVEADSLSSTDGSSWIDTSCSQEFLEGDHIGYGALSSEQIYRLRCITEKLNSAGRLQECIEVYNISRKSVVQASISRLSIGNWGFIDIRSLDRTEFARKIKVWIRAAQLCFLIIFPREKQNYEKTFDGFEDVTYANCFETIVKDVANQLCNFAETISTSAVSLEKMFSVLDMYKFMLLYLPDIKSTFRSASTECICAQAERTLDRLSYLIRETLSSFEETLLHEQSNTPISRGTLHSLTRYTMNYVTEMVHYNEILSDIIISVPTTCLVATTETQFLEVGDRKPLALHLLWIIISLKFNLEVKFTEYKDIELAHLFFMNNLHYIVEEIRGSYELVEMIGEDYVTKLSNDVLAEARNYLRSWDKVLYCLRDEGLYYKVFYNGISKNTLKERFKSFNAKFEEVLQNQSVWFIPDLQLRNQLRQMILSRLVPAYKSLVEKFSSHLENERYKERYIKYSTDEVENKIQYMFIE